jgi:uncharacterized protein
MKKIFQIGLLLFLGVMAQAQKTNAIYNAQIEQHRAKYKSEFLEDKNAPVTELDFKYLQFYKPNINYKVQAKFVKLENEKAFDMQTHSGKIKQYFKYGFVTFTINKMPLKLFIYQSESLMQKVGFEDYLFLPFTDNTNYNTTFGGGRYLDFKLSHIKNNILEIDFNKCYNPYCAFAEGYSCPIPPAENSLNIAIPAGEKLWNKKVK